MSEKTDWRVFLWGSWGKKSKKLLFFEKKRILLPKIAVLYGILVAIIAKEEYCNLVHFYAVKDESEAGGVKNSESGGGFRCVPLNFLR